MTRNEAVNWVNVHDDDSDLDRGELAAAFVALVGRSPDSGESVSEQWSNCVIFAAMLSYRELLLIDAQGNGETTIGDAIDRAIASHEIGEFDGQLLTVASDGSVESWDGYFVAAPGENPDWDTPRLMVDWSGFAEAVSEIRKG
jgi:hypothetical protein